MGVLDIWSAFTFKIKDILPSESDYLFWGIFHEVVPYSAYSNDLGYFLFLLLT